MISVLSQTVLRGSSDELHYIIKDGASTDSTMSKIRKVALEYVKFPNITIEIISQVDEGMYDALASSFQDLPQGDVYSYINAGDYYSIFAFEIVAEIFTSNDVQFLTGLSCVYNEKNHLLSCILPYRYDQALLLAGYYGTVLPHVQQESTFWGFKLHKTICLDSLKKMRLAGDYLLWKSFIYYEPLYIVSAYLGGFKIHMGQLTGGGQKEYKQEIRQLAESGSGFMLLKAIVYQFCWLLPNLLKKKISKQIFEYDHSNMVYKIRSFD